MIKKLFGFVMAASLAGPCMAASVIEVSEPEERRSSAAAGIYLSVPFGGERSGRPQAGIRLRMSHDYRNSSAPTAPILQPSLFDLRLVGDRESTLYVAGMPVTGREARRLNLTGGGSIVTVAILAAAIVGGVVIYNAIDGDGDGDDDEELCLLPEGCP